MAGKYSKSDDLLIRSLVRRNMYVLIVVKEILGNDVPKEPTNRDEMDKWALSIIGKLHEKGFELEVSEKTEDRKSIMSVHVYMHGTADHPKRMLLYRNDYPGRKSLLSGD